MRKYRGTYEAQLVTRRKRQAEAHSVVDRIECIRMELSNIDLFYYMQFLHMLFTFYLLFILTAGGGEEGDKTNETNNQRQKKILEVTSLMGFVGWKQQ